MDIEQHLSSYLSKNIDLNPDRINRLEEAERIMQEFIEKDSVFSSNLIEIIPQGSYRQGTIIKPVNEDVGFDVDLLVALKSFNGWEAKDYLSNLASSFKSNGRYKDLTETNGKTRCVTIDYEGEFHIDLVPAILEEDHYKICNKKTNEFEISDGDGYANWFAEKNILANTHLIDVIRILKYLRDSEKEFDTKSIILTTLVAMQIEEQTSINDSYDSLFSTLKTVLINIDNYLNQFSAPPSIPNPAMPEENFNRHWKDDQVKFNQLKKAISKYRTNIEMAFINIADESKVKKHLTEVFGDGFFNVEKIQENRFVTPPAFNPHPPHVEL